MGGEVREIGDFAGDCVSDQEEEMGGWVFVV